VHASQPLTAWKLTHSLDESQLQQLNFRLSMPNGSLSAAWLLHSPLPSQPALELRGI
jgi:hypothetical protein